MTDSKLLKKEIEKSGLKLTYIAGVLDLSRAGLYKKINGITEFTASEIALLQKILKLSDESRDEIFFAQKVDL